PELSLFAAPGRISWRARCGGWLRSLQWLLLSQNSKCLLGLLWHASWICRCTRAAAGRRRGRPCELNQAIRFLFGQPLERRIGGCILHCSSRRNQSFRIFLLVVLGQRQSHVNQSIRIAAELQSLLKVLLSCCIVLLSQLYHSYR